MALGKIFEFKGGMIIPKEDCKHIVPLTRFLEKYYVENPKNLLFLHYMKSMNKDDNPYADVDLNIREEQIIYDLKLDIDTSDEVVEEALKCVEGIYYTTFFGVYRGFKAMLDKIGHALYTTDIDFNAKEGNAAAIKGFMKDYENLRRSFKEAYKDYEQEQGQMRGRGGAPLAFDEDEDY